MATTARWRRRPHRRAEVSPKALDRYCTALARVDGTTTLQEPTASIEKRVRWNRRWVRALHPLASSDLALLEAVNRGEFAINGLRNRDLQHLLFSAAHSPLPRHRPPQAHSQRLALGATHHHSAA